MVIFPSCSFIVKTCFWYSDIFAFPHEFENCFFHVFEECVGILMGTALNLEIAFGRMAIFTMLILPIQKCGRSFHRLRFSLISFLRDLKFLSYRSVACLVRVTPRYFILFVAIVKAVVSLISSSACLSFV